MSLRFGGMHTAVGLQEVLLRAGHQCQGGDAATQRLNLHPGAISGIGPCSPALWLPVPVPIPIVIPSGSWWGVQPWAVPSARSVPMGLVPLQAAFTSTISPHPRERVLGQSHHGDMGRERWHLNNISREWQHKWLLGNPQRPWRRRVLDRQGQSHPPGMGGVPEMPSMAPGQCSLAPGLCSLAPGLQLAHSSASQALGLCSRSIGCSGAAAWCAGSVLRLSQPDTGLPLLWPQPSPACSPTPLGWLWGSRTLVAWLGHAQELGVGLSQCPWGCPSVRVRAGGCVCVSVLRRAVCAELLLLLLASAPHRLGLGSGFSTSLWLLFLFAPFSPPFFSFIFFLFFFS